MVGPTLGGGRHRNHCPFCLHSRHVDDARPGDRVALRPRTGTVLHAFRESDAGADG